MFCKAKCVTTAYLEMFYLNTIEQSFLFVEMFDQTEVCLPYSKFLTGIQKLLVFQNFGKQISVWFLCWLIFFEFLREYFRRMENGKNWV